MKPGVTLVTAVFFIYLQINLSLEENIFKESEKDRDSENGWSEWSEWSSCSRSCGGGVTVQSRRCLNWQGCKGGSVRYNLCEDIPCPEGSRDFLAVQCSEHDNAFLYGDDQKWEPIEGGDLCVLTCKVKGTNGPPVVLSPRVLDGTPCGVKSNGVCVHGQCQKVGCDRIIGSKKESDVCGVCGGNGDSCEAGSFQWHRKVEGPCSATCGGGYRVLSARCEKIKTGQSVNHSLCKALTRPPPIISTCGESACPASWHTGKWIPCSASCGRGYQLREVYCAEKGNDSFRRVADHSCFDARPAHRRTCDQGCPRWYEGVWSECSVSCGDGVQRRTVSCRIEDGQSSDFCNFSHRPNSTRPCRTGVKCSFVQPSKQLLPPAWLKDSMEDTSLFSERKHLMVNERVPSEPTFIAGSWSNCSSICGEGVRVRNVTCKIYLEFSKTVPILPDAQCPGKRPVEAKRCFLKECPNVESRDFINESQGDVPDWGGHPLSSFEDPEPHSRTHKGVLPPSKLQSMEQPSIADDSQALEIGSPNSEEAMDTLLYPMIHYRKPSSNVYVYNNEIVQVHHYRWRKGRFSSCSRHCLGGVQESEPICIDNRNEARVSNQLCNSIEKPDSITKTCNDSPCPPKWEVSGFKKCSKPCGGGITRREVVCVHEMTRGNSGKMTIRDSRCPQPPPYAQKYCNMEACPPRWARGKWTRCSTDCNNGYRTRELKCVQRLPLSGELNLSHDRCPTTKPATRRRCARKSCSNRKNGRKSHRPLIKAQLLQDYHQKKFMKTVLLKIGGFASVFHGANLKLKCPVRRFNKKNISWWRNGALLGPMKETLDRIKVTKKSVLKIHRIRYTDAGIYFCKAGHQEANITLRVQPLPSSFGSSEEGEKDATQFNGAGKWKFGSNNIYIQSSELPEHINANKHADQNVFKLHSVPSNNNGKSSHFIRPSSITETTTVSSEGRLVKLKLQTKEDDLHGNPLRPFIYGKINKKGIPASLSQPVRGIGLLSEKVARSKANNGWRDGGSLIVPQRLPDDAKHVYGTVLNLTQVNQVSNLGQLQFGTVRDMESEELSENNEQIASNVADSGISSPTILRNYELMWPAYSTTSPDESGDATKESFRRHLPSDPPRTGPHILGNGNRDSLEFEWKVTNWTQCSQTCSFTGSSGGYQFRSSRCVVRVEDVTKTIDGALCLDAGLAAPTTFQKCGFQECPQWQVEEWSDCENSRCYTLHYALQKRNVTCNLFNGGETSIKQCDEVAKPRQQRECFNRQCIGVWTTGNWSQCVAPCEGQGYMTRLLQCVWNGTSKSAGNACREKARPEVVRWCYGAPCPEDSNAEQVEDKNCEDRSRYCRLVVRINMCQHFRKECCKSCK